MMFARSPAEQEGVVVKGLNKFLFYFRLCYQAGSAIIEEPSLSRPNNIAIVEIKASGLRRQ